MNFTTEKLKAIYGMAMGYGTEVLPGKDPHRLTVSANKWGGTPLDNSGYSIGIIQFDFGQQNPSYATQFVQLVNEWARLKEFSRLSVTDIRAAEMLHSFGAGIQWFSSSDRDKIRTWGLDPENRKIFYDTFERVIIEKNVPEIAKAIDDARFNSLTDTDQLRIILMLSKAINQGGNGGFIDAKAIINNLSLNKYNADESKGSETFHFIN